MNHIQVVGHQIPVNFYTGPGPQVAAVLNREVRLVWIPSSPAGGSRSGPLHMITAHRT